MTDGQEVRVMRLRYSGRCGCGADVPAGTRAGWNSASRLIVCEDCLTRLTPTIPAPPSFPRVQEEPEASLRERAQRDAGASLSAEYERRMARRDERVRQRLPRIGGLLLRVFDESPSTQAFKKGAAGERDAIKRLLADTGSNALFLVNRRLGAGRRDGDVDIVAVTPAGVTVIDVKRYKDAKVRVERHGGLLSERRDVLQIRGRDHSRLLDGLAKQIAAVTQALRAVDRFAEVPVTGALCFVDADLPLFGRLEARGYAIATAKGTAKALREGSGHLPWEVVEQVADHLDAALPSALEDQA
jgi:hypothetical protein